MRLTPAGEALFEDLKGIYAQYLASIERAQMLQRGMFGELTIGILDGHRVSDTFPTLVSTLQNTHPNLSVNLFRGSFHELGTALYDGQADFIITLGFAIQDKQQFSSLPLSKTKDYMAMLRSNPLAQHLHIALSDLKDQQLIAISKEDSPIAYEGMKELHHRVECNLPMKVAPNLETLMLWIQAGLGISILNDFNSLAQDEDLVFLDWELTEDIPAHATDLVLAWRKDNCNPAHAIFLDAVSRE